MATTTSTTPDLKAVLDKVKELKTQIKQLPKSAAFPDAAISDEVIDETHRERASVKEVEEAEIG